jgi:hypothetical protein
MWAKLLLNVGLAIVSALPTERIVAWLCNRMLDRIDKGGNLDKAAKTADKLLQLAQVLSDAIEDRQISPDEARTCMDLTAAVRREIIGEWAQGRSAKSLEKTLNGATN